MKKLQVTVGLGYIGTGKGSSVLEVVNTFSEQVVCN